MFLSKISVNNGVAFSDGMRYVGSGRGKVFTAWIGKIAPTVEKESLKEILECCGSIRVFRPYIDSTKGFCFVTYHHAQGVMLAETLLQDLLLDGQALVVRLNKVRLSQWPDTDDMTNMYIHASEYGSTNQSDASREVCCWRVPCTY